jgi:hypothetical protein
LFLAIISILWLAAWPNHHAFAAPSSEELGLCDSSSVSSMRYAINDNLPEPDDCPSPGVMSSAEISQLLLPDLLTLTPYDLEIATLPDGSRELRLSNTIWNNGTGPLELEGENNPATEITRVEQHIYMQSGSRFTRLVGEYVWHPIHDHWHFEKFSVYELWTLNPIGELNVLVSSSDKVSYCVIDTDIVDRDLEGFSPYRRYTGCGQTLQGQSVGWGDTYKSHLDGQSIHLDAVSDGFYALKSTANPDGILLESNYDNNASTLFLEIRGASIILIGLVEFLEWRCQESDWWMIEDMVCRV